MKKYLLMVFSACLLASCAAQPRGPSYAEQVAQIPAPVSNEDRQHKCAFLRSEIARQVNLADTTGAMMGGMYAVYSRDIARQNIAALQSRAADFGCSAPFSSR